MTQKIAIVSLATFLILTQHVYSWAMREVSDRSSLDRAGISTAIGIYLGLTLLNVVITISLFNLLIEVAKNN